MNDDHRPRGEHELTLVPLLTEVGRARRFARFVLQEQQIPEDRIAAADQVKARPGPLPRRIRSGRPAPPIVVRSDPELLRRVRDGLLALDADGEAAR